LGVLLDAVAHGLLLLPTIRLNELPRMADFALWATACERAFWPTGTFLAAYRGNRTDAATKLIDTDLVACAVRTLVANHGPWSGTATELDATLRLINKDAGVKDWPPSPRILAGHLRRLDSSLAKVGIELRFDRTGRDRTRVITISKRPEHPVVPIDTEAPDAGEPTLSSASSAATQGSRPAGSVDGGLGVETGPTATGVSEPTKIAEPADAADAADAEIKDKSTKFVRLIPTVGRSIPVFERRNRKPRRPGHGDDSASK
jgi:hypothetical protein